MGKNGLQTAFSKAGFKTSVLKPAQLPLLYLRFIPQDASDEFAGL
jgi:hypothetical protein